MSISFGSILICTLIIAVLYCWWSLIFYVKTSICAEEIRIIIYGVILLGIRLLIPLNYPFTVTVRVDGFLLKISNFFLLNNWQNLSLMDIFIIVWVIGVVINISKFAIKSYKSNLLIKQLVSLDNNHSKGEKVYQILKEFNLKDVRIAVIDDFISPAITGIRNPILIISNYDYSENELRCIVAHEVVHLKRHDLIIRYILEICKCIYWWNPIMYLFIDRFFLAIEVANDISVIQNYNHKKRIEYIKCLIKTYKLCNKNKMTNNCIEFVSIPFVAINDRLQIRIKKIMQYSNTIKVKIFGKLLVLIFVCMMLSGIVIVPEAYQIPTCIQETTFSVNKDNAYLIKTTKGYELYVNDTYITTISKIDDSFKTLRVYEE